MGCAGVEGSSSYGTNRVGVFPPSHENGNDPVSETLCFLVFGLQDDGKVSEIHPYNFRCRNACYEQVKQNRTGLKGKAIHVPESGGLQSCETSRSPHFVDNWLTDGGELAGRFVVLISVRGCCKRAILSFHKYCCLTLLGSIMFNIR
jgi:hypothetical protein